MTTVIAVFVFAIVAGLAPAVADAQNRPPTQIPPAASMPSAAPVTRAPAPAPGTTPAAGGGGPALSSDYVIGVGDVLQISVWKNETLSRVVPVRPDGKVSMPLLHDVQAAGLTAMQLRDKISQALAAFMPYPEIAVAVTEVHSFRVSVLGEVQKPGVMSLRGRITILEAIAMAGGFRDFASPSKITVVRTDENGASQTLRFNYNRAVRNSDEEPNLVLRSGDVIIVP
jgi:polysaccharide export outer membrane protein